MSLRLLEDYGNARIDEYAIKYLWVWYLKHLAVFEISRWYIEIYICMYIEIYMYILTHSPADGTAARL